MNIQEIKEQVSIVDFLARLGIPPSKTRGMETHYISPIRDNDTNPSFSVNEKKGKWIDYGTGEGGDILDLAMRVLQVSSYKEAVRSLNQMYNDSIIPSLSHRKQQPAANDPTYEIYRIKPLGNNAAITQYLEYRRILGIADEHLKEVYYKIRDDQGNEKRYFGVGWRNLLNGWEIRNRYWKGCLGKKEITFLASIGETAVVFEGMLDYLSYLKDQPQGKLRSAVILNSLALTNRALDKIKQEPHIKSIHLYLDNDTAGKEATKTIKGIFLNSKDMSSTYSGFKDYNEFLQKRESKPWITEHTAERFSSPRIR